MDDTISRADAIDEIARWIGYLDDDMIGRIQLGLKRLPSADRPTGEWVGAREFCQHLEEVTGEKYQVTGIENMIYCNQCWQASRRHSKYCPYCGAKMKRG